MSSYASHYASPADSYISNLGHAARAFLSALFAVKADASPARIAENMAIAERSKARGVAQLYFEANRCQDLMPNLAAELRCIALRA